MKRKSLFKKIKVLKIGDSLKGKIKEATKAINLIKG